MSSSESISSPPSSGRMRGAARTAQLLDAAEELFAERGYSNTSIEEIARAAGVTRPVVYERLGNKETAYLAVIDRVRAQLEDRMTHAALSVPGARDQLVAGCEAYFAYLEEQPRRWIILYGSSTAVVGDLGEALTRARFGTVEKITLLLREHLAGLDETHVEMYSHVVSGAVEQLGRWWIRHPEVDRREVVDRLVDVVWGGLERFVVADVSDR